MNIVSLFTGAMGLDLGLEAAGFQAEVCADTDRFCRETIAANKPESRILDDVAKVTIDTAPRNPCIVAGGPPCQSWSTAGRRKGFDDPRGEQVLEFGRVVADLRPRFFVMENVRGLTSMLTGDNRLAINVIEEEFESIGYKVVRGVLNAVDYGTPQFRDRLIMIGSRDGEDIFLPLPTHFQKHQEESMRWVTLGKALQGIAIDSPGDFQEFSPRRKSWLEKIPPGGNWKSLSEQDQRKAMGEAYNSGGGKTGFFRRLSYDEPSPTLVTSPTQKSTILCHPEKTRPLSTLEYARIQDFPRGWSIRGNTTEVYRQIGNAVPVRLGRAIGQALLSTMSKSHVVKASRVRKDASEEERTPVRPRKRAEEEELTKAGMEAWGMQDV